MNIFNFKNKVFTNKVTFTHKYYKKDTVNNNEVQKKKELMYKIVTDNELDIKKIIGDKIFNQFTNIKNILIVGNGPIKKNIINTLFDYDIIVRFNNYQQDNPRHLVGTKTDIHFTCIPGKLEIYETWLSKDTKIIIPMEIRNQQRYKFLEKLNLNNLFIPNQKYRYIINSEKTDFTRGFYGLSIMLQLKENYFPNCNIDIIGFGGSGHHYNLNNIMLHGHNNELEVIKYLKKKKVITDLND